MIISRSVKHDIEQFDEIFLFSRNLFQKYLQMGGLTVGDAMTCKARQRLKGLITSIAGVIVIIIITFTVIIAVGVVIK